MYFNCIKSHFDYSDWICYFAVGSNYFSGTFSNCDCIIYKINVFFQKSVCALNAKNSQVRTVSIKYITAQWKSFYCSFKICYLFAIFLNSVHITILWEPFFIISLRITINRCYEIVNAYYETKESALKFCKLCAEILPYLCRNFALFVLKNGKICGNFILSLFNFCT